MRFDTEPSTLPRGHARLIQRRGFNQIADRLGLRQIDSAIQISPQCEFARFGQPGSPAHCRSMTESQDDGRAVAGDLDQVFGGIGSRRREIRHHYVINRGAGIVDQFRERRLQGFH